MGNSTAASVSSAGSLPVNGRRPARGSASQPLAPHPVSLARAVSGDELDPLDGAVVVLNVYDLNSDWLAANHILTEMLQIGGAFHAGVEAYGVEVTYGRDGITFNKPKSHDVHVYRQSVVMGRTDHTPESIQATVDEKLAPNWKGSDYNMLNNNCVSFCRYLCYLLVGQAIPGWVDRLAKCTHIGGLDTVITNVMQMRPRDESTESLFSVDEQSPMPPWRLHHARYSTDMLDPITDGNPPIIFTRAGLAVAAPAIVPVGAAGQARVSIARVLP